MNLKRNLFLAALIGGAGLLFAANPPAPDAHDHADGKKEKHDAHDHADGKKEKHDAHDHADEARNNQGKSEEPPIHLTPAQRKLIQIRITRAIIGEPEQIIRLNGEIRLNMDETARIMPRMPGFVTEIPVKEGDRVTKRQLLARLTSHKLGEYYFSYQSDAEREKLTKSEYQMAERLRKTNSISEKEYLRYKREYADATIARRKSEALLKSLLLDPGHTEHQHKQPVEDTICTDYDIRAPFAGTVIAKDLTVGENFAEDNTKVVLTVSNLENLWLDLRADASELKEIHRGMDVSVRITGSPNVLSGKIVYIAPLIDEATRTGLVRVLLKNKNGEARPGEFAVGTIIPKTGKKSVLVPADAVQLIAGETVLFVPQGDGFAPKPVAVGRTRNGMTSILSGLKPNEMYVSGGAFELKSVLLTSGLDPHAGHGH